MRSLHGYLRALCCLFLMLGILLEGCKRSPFDPESRLKELGYSLHPPGPPLANYVGAVRTGHYIYLAGHPPQKPDGSLYTGKLGRDLTVEQGQQAARLSAINLLSTLKAEIGDLRKVRKIIKVFGMVNSSDAFTDDPKVIDGASDLLVSIFGKERGKHARSAVGMASLPFGIAVEIEMIVEVTD